MRIARCSPIGSIVISGNVWQILISCFRLEDAEASWLAERGMSWLFSPLDDYFHSVPGAQGHRRINLHRMTGQKLHPKLLSQRCQHEDDLHHRERGADAGARPTSKGKVGILRQAFGELIRPTPRD